MTSKTSDDDDEHHRAGGAGGTVMLAVPSKKVRALSLLKMRCDICVLDWKEAPSPFVRDVFSRNLFLSLSLFLRRRRRRQQRAR